MKVSNAETRIETIMVLRQVVSTADRATVLLERCLVDATPQAEAQAAQIRKQLRVVASIVQQLLHEIEGTK